jgi:SPP1 family predicted phage head-tail adaptor
MRSGPMDQRVTILLPSTASSTQSGAGVQTFTAGTEVFASVTSLSGAELLAAGSISSEVTYEVEMRIRPDVTANARLRWTPFGGATRVLHVHSVQPSSRTDGGMKLMCGVIE